MSQRASEPVSSAVSACDRYCDRCGRAAADGSHAACLRARDLEPPRYCAHCHRRMVVQVTPIGWTARCVEHGELASAG